MNPANSPSPAAAATPPQDRKPACGSLDYLLLALAVLLGLCMANSGSFWIDEAQSAHFAMQSGISAWWKSLNVIPTDVQMALYYFQLWIWEKLVGSSEWLLRLNNVPWYLAGIFAWFFAMPKRLRGIIVLLAALSPFAWYYVNEIRPYAMLFGATSLMFAGLFRCAASGFSKPWLWSLGVGCVLAAGASSVAIPWVGVTFLAALVLYLKSNPRIPFPVEIAVALAIPGLCIMGLYSWSYLHGSRVASPEHSTVGSLLFAPYELLGFTGLGPARAALREVGIGSIKTFLPGIVLLFASLTVVAIAGFRYVQRRLGSRSLLVWLALYTLPLIAVTALGISSGLRTTGRHFTPALVLALPLLTVGVDALWMRKSLWTRAVVAAFVVCWLASSFEIRFAARHKKDNYRDAASIANAALTAGKQVWWSANRNGALYYRLPLSDNGAPHTARSVISIGSLPSPLPDVVICSRDDVFDNQHVLAKMISGLNFKPVQKLQGFVVWERPGDSSHPR